MPELRTRRARLRRSEFAYVDKMGGEHLPIHDESHVRNAIARFNQTEFESEKAKASARRKIVAAATRHGIGISREDTIARPVESLRAASTKRGPRGGRKTLRPERPTTARQRAAARRNIKKAARARLRKVRARKR